MSDAPEEFEPRLDPRVIEEMRARLRAARWPEPAEPGGGDPWAWGADFTVVREVCEWWTTEYDPRGLSERLAEHESLRWRGICLQRARSEAGGGLPVLLIHGWPGAPLEFRGVAPILLEAGHDVVMPALPGFGFSEAPRPPLAARDVAGQLAGLMEALGYRRWLVQGGDWGSHIGAALAHLHGERVAGLHLNSPGVLPLPGDLGSPPPTDAEIDYAGRARRWRAREGNHLIVQAAAPDAIGVGLHDSPAGLAGWLLPRYRAWSDCGGDLLGRFEMRDLCDLLTFYWATGSATSSMRLYAASGRDRWRLRPGELIHTPAAVADFPHEILRPPRSWTERVLADLRSWSEMPRGGHFAAWEEPELLAADVIGFARGLD